MLCPFCSTALRVVNRHGVEIEWCPSCKGVWLERGELDKLIERAGRDEEGDRPSFTVPVREQARSDHRSNGWGVRPPKKRRSFLSELFDVD